MFDLLNSFQDTLKVVLGAFIGLLGGIVAWHLQNTTHERRHREELLLKVIRLALHSLTYTRCVAYGKFDNDQKAIINLPENPVDELLAIVLIYFPSAFALAQKLHSQQQAVYAFPAVDPRAPEVVKELASKMATTVTELVKEMNDISAKEKIGVNLEK